MNHEPRVTHVRECRVPERSLPTAVIFNSIGISKKRRVVTTNDVWRYVDNGTFVLYTVLLVFGTNGGVGSKCSMLLSTMAEKLN